MPKRATTDCVDLQIFCNLHEDTTPCHLCSTYTVCPSHHSPALPDVTFNEVKDGEEILCEVNRADVVDCHNIVCREHHRANSQ